MPKASPPIDPVELDAYFAVLEVSSLLRHAVEQQLREAGDLSAVQFQLLATLRDAPGGSSRMTDLADGVVYSRSGLTYQAGLLERRGLLTRVPSTDDERSITATITDAGRALLADVFPGHVAVLRELLLQPLDRAEVRALGAILGSVREHMRALPPRSAAPRRGRGAAASHESPDSGPHGAPAERSRESAPGIAASRTVPPLPGARRGNPNAL